jgi:hypothetical protein
MADVVVEDGVQPKKAFQRSLEFDGGRKKVVLWSARCGQSQDPTGGCSCSIIYEIPIDELPSSVMQFGSATHLSWGLALFLEITIEGHQNSAMRQEICSDTSGTTFANETDENI